MSMVIGLVIGLTLPLMPEQGLAAERLALVQDGKPQSFRQRCLAPV